MNWLGSRARSRSTTTRERTPTSARTDVEENHSPEVIAIEGTEAYVWTPNGVKAMTLSYAYLEKRFGSAATARNWSTLGKIVARF